MIQITTCLWESFLHHKYGVRRHVHDGGRANDSDAGRGVLLEVADALLEVTGAAALRGRDQTSLRPGQGVWETYKHSPPP